MATTIGTLAAHFTADASGFSTGVNQVKQSLSQADAAFTSTAAKVAGFIGGLAIAQRAMQFFGFGLKLAAEAEQAQIAFEVMLGSAGEAAKMLKEIQNLADKSPYGGPALRDAAKTLLAFGVEAEGILPTLRMLGDVASGDEQKLGSLALVFGQVAANARLTGGDLLQFVNSTFNPLAEIAKRTGEEISDVRKRMEQGAVGIDEVRQAFVDATSAGGRFYLSMERQATTLAGRFSTLSDSAQSVARSVGQVLAPAAGAFVDKATSLIAMMQSLDVETVRNTASMVAFGASFTAALIIIPRIIQAASFLVTALRSVASAQALVQALSGPKGWAVLIASLGVAAASVYALDAGFSEYAKNLEEAKRQAEQLAEAQGGLAEANKEVAKSTTEQLKGEIQAMLMQVEAQQERMRAKAEEIKAEIDNTRERYAQLRRQLEAGGAGGFTAAVEANTVAGFEAIQRGEATMNVVRAIDKLREQEAADTSRLEQRLRALEDALKAGQIKVKEVKI